MIEHSDVTVLIKIDDKNECEMLSISACHTIRTIKVAVFMHQQKLTTIY